MFIKPWQDICVRSCTISLTQFTTFWIFLQNMTLHHYTLYKPSDLCDCAKALHRLFCNSPGSNLPAIREKYSQHKVQLANFSFCFCFRHSYFWLYWWKVAWTLFSYSTNSWPRNTAPHQYLRNSSKISSIEWPVVENGPNSSHMHPFWCAKFLFESLGLRSFWNSHGSGCC